MTGDNLNAVSGWRDVWLRTMQKTRGIRCAKVTVEVYVSDGEAVGWEEPLVTKLEPQSRWASLIRRAFDGAGTS